MTISIRRAEPGDYDAVHRIFTGSRVVLGTLQMPDPNPEFMRKRVGEAPEVTYMRVACVEQEVIGHLGLHTFPNHPRRRHIGQIGMAVRDDWQGHGVGTALMEAAVDMAEKWLNLRRLELEVYTDNEPALRLYSKFGFELEGTLVQAAFRDGRYVDVYTLARMRPE